MNYLVSGILVVNSCVLNSYDKIVGKLKEFTKKYYSKQLIKGFLLFLTFGLLFWIAVLYLEHLLWLEEDWRLGLFVVFLVIEGLLIFKFVVVPTVFLIGLKKGISAKDASRIIERHFPKVNDQLYNLLELADNQKKSELLLASIEQRARTLSVVPFTEAVKLSEVYKYVRYIGVPLGILGLIWFSGNIGTLFGSHERLVNYDVAYTKPAPFTFEVLNKSLVVLDNEPLVVKVAVRGEVIPDEVFMVLHNDEILLRKEKGTYNYTFEAPVKESSFHLTAQGWSSGRYTVRGLSTPFLLDYSLRFRYPAYLKRAPQEIKGTGNAIVPEGTKVEWNIEGRNVERIDLIATDTSVVLSRDGNEFHYSAHIFKDLEYELSTSNSNVKGFEKLGYRLEVIKDEYPVIGVQQFLDSVNVNQSFFSGQVSDDHGVRSIAVVCYPVNDDDDIQRIILSKPNGNVEQFYYTFPSGFRITEGEGYRLFFEVVDNDGLRKGKVSRSRVFEQSVMNAKELKNKQLERQSIMLNELNRSVDKYKKQAVELDKINKFQKEVSSLSFESKNRIRDFLQNQERQEQLMEKFSKEFGETLNKDDGDNELKKMLKERLERQELQAKKNRKLLKELNQLTDKIEREELKKELEEFGKRQNSNARSLEQILELTKRYYITEKTRQLSSELKNLSEEQMKLSESKKASDYESQEGVNEKFNQLSKELDELRRDGEALKKPIKIDVEKRDQEAVEQDQKDALEEMEKEENGKDAGDKLEGESNRKVIQKQKSAGQKMEDMSKKLQQNAMAGGGSSVTEDAEMLRQILDNLITFSVKQESLFEGLDGTKMETGQFSSRVKDQKELRRLFEHVDDSLFSLSLRRAELSEFVNEQITEVYYNIDKSLESAAESQFFQAASYQQYVVNATNTLADFLANILDNMQESMKPGKGSGKSGADFQLPDIIKGQESIQQKIGSSGKQGQKQDGEQGENGKKGNGLGQKGKGKNEELRDGGKDRNGERGGENGGEKEGSGSNEMGLNEVYEIYKEQQFLRNQLERQLKNMIDNSDRNLAKKLLRQMEDFENDLLENGITERTRNKVNVIQHELLKLEDAALKQGKKKERESNSNHLEYSAPNTTKPEVLNKRARDVEILNRQALPLRQNYEKKVKVYFKNDSIPF